MNLPMYLHGRGLTKEYHLYRFLFSSVCKFVIPAFYSLAAISILSFVIPRRRG
ncbi:hypothetical protein CbuG_1423 [Coxiella burnetii CbuG_Q212]|nr:hypothetical protein CbuG_1423 [Coxiella burnetii CbuG_Q212]